MSLAHPHRVMGASWLPDGQRIATTCWDGMVRIWDTTTGAQLQAFGDPVLHFLDIAVSPDGTRVAGTTHAGYVGGWEIASGRRVFSLSAHTGASMSVAWSPDGALLATVGIDSSLRIWDPVSGRLLASHLGDGRELLQVTWLDNLRLLVAASTRGEIWAVERDARSLAELEALAARTPWRLVDGRLELAR